ncbi:MAG: UDP-glucose 4-epimerase GalE [Alphaproteobacteria bacterium]
MSNILVTGGAGYIGSHVCKALAAIGLTPVIYDNLKTGRRDFTKWGVLEEGDICDLKRLGEVFNKYSIKAVIHLAGLISVAEAEENPKDYYQNNVFGSITLFKIMQEYGVKNVIFSSSACVYGTPKEMPVTEESALEPTNTYGKNKYITELMLQDLQKQNAINFVALRYFNAAGAHPDGDIGESHDPETHLIPRAIRAALGEEEAFKVYGTDYDTKDGTAIRDYIHVNDLAQAHINALAYLLEGGESIALNLGTGQGHSVLEVIEAIENLSGKDIKRTNDIPREGDVPVLLADASKAEKVLGWKPTQSDLNNIIQTAWKWHRSQENRI